MPTTLTGIWFGRDQRWEFATEADAEAAVTEATKAHAARVAAAAEATTDGRQGKADVNCDVGVDDDTATAPSAEEALSAFERINQIIGRHPESTITRAALKRIPPAEHDPLLQALLLQFGPEPPVSASHPAPARPPQARRCSAPSSDVLFVERRTLDFGAVHGPYFPVLPLAATTAASEVDGGDAAPVSSFCRVSMRVIGVAAPPDADRPIVAQPPEPAEAQPMSRRAREYLAQKKARKQRRDASKALDTSKAVCNDGDQPAFN